MKDPRSESSSRTSDVAMHASVTLESPHQVFTNLDHVVGNVNMYLDGPTNIVSIVAKLEGESITQLLAPPRDPMDEKPRPVQEKHKVSFRTLDQHLSIP